MTDWCLGQGDHPRHDLRKTPLTWIHSDHTSREGQAHLYLPGVDIVLATDKDCHLIGLWSPLLMDRTTAISQPVQTPNGRAEPRYRQATDVIFDGQTSQTITNLRRINIRSPWQPRELIPGLVGFDDQPDSDIVGSCLNGSFVEITLLQHEAWRLLRYIQNLCGRSFKICPLSDAFFGRIPLEPRTIDSAVRHIDGDVLTSLVEHGEETLRELLNADHNPTTSLRRMPRTYPSPEQRHDTLREYLQELCGSSDRTDSELVHEILGYLRKVLQCSF